MKGLVARVATGAALASLTLTQALGQSTPFEPVTDAMIQDPDPKDWLSWRRTLDSWGYSPLDQIERDNVDELRMVWVRPLEAGHQEGTPLVHNGVMYFPGPSDRITAMDAASGDVLWIHTRELPEDLAQSLTFPDTNRNLAIYGNLIIARGSDDHIYAVDAETGQLAWETRIMDYKKGAKQSSGPIIADGLAITGRSCEPEGGPDACVITAHDARTGREVWRTSTIARGQDPNDATWGGTPLERRMQVGAWMNASYDPELKLLYMGTSVSTPAPKFLLAGNEHTYLYHNSTLALDVRTGRIVWHYQHVVDHWDLDHPFPRILLDEQVAPDPSEVTWINPNIRHGGTYKVLTGVPGKTGIVYTLDRQTGAFLWARPTVMQNVVQSIDGATGRVTVNPETVFTETGGPPRLVCPSSTGGANYQAPAYSPLTKTMYFPMQQLCMNSTAVPANWDRPGYSISTRIALSPEADNNLGVIHAVNAVTGRSEWKYAIRAGMQSLLATGGNLLFAGDAAGRFRALDQESGRVLWEVNLGSAVTGYPVTFSVGGHQYVAVSTGFWLGDAYTPELVHGTQGTLFVFALPEAGIGRQGPPRPPVNPSGNARSLDPAPGAAQRLVSSGVFAAAQARDGQAVYARSCAACHGASFEPAQGTPPVRGPTFLANWRGRTLADLHAKVRTMPPGAADSLPAADYLAVLAYLLEANGFPAGQPLPVDDAGLRAIVFGD